MTVTPGRTQVGSYGVLIQFRASAHAFPSCALHRADQRPVKRVPISILTSGRTPGMRHAAFVVTASSSFDGAVSQGGTSMMGYRELVAVVALVALTVGPALAHGGGGAGGGGGGAAGGGGGAGGGAGA